MIVKDIFASSGEKKSTLFTIQEAEFIRWGHPVGRSFGLLSPKNKILAKAQQLWIEKVEPNKKIHVNHHNVYCTTLRLRKDLNLY